MRAANSRITAAFNEGIMGAVTTKTLVREEASCRRVFRALTGAMRTRQRPRRFAGARCFMPLVVSAGQHLHGAGP